MAANPQMEVSTPSRNVGQIRRMVLSTGEPDFIREQREEAAKLKKLMPGAGGGKVQP